MKQLILIILSVCSLCSLSAQHPSFLGADYSGGKVFVMENNEIVWEHPAPESNDVWVLPNGNFLFTTGKGVLEMNRANDTLFCYQSASPVFACQRLKNGNTFVGECNTGRLLELSPKGKIKKEICILPEGVSDGGHAFMRNARRLDNGNYLVAHYGSQTVKEYNPKGKIVWDVRVPGGPHSVIRLPNGNTLVAVADMTQNPRIVELNPQGNTVWELTNKDLPGAPLKFIGGMQYFPESGLLYFTNWVGHANPKTSIHLFCVNKEKKVFYSLGNHAGIQTMSSLWLIKPFN